VSGRRDTRGRRRRRGRRGARLTPFVSARVIYDDDREGGLGGGGALRGVEGRVRRGRHIILLGSWQRDYLIGKLSSFFISSQAENVDGRQGKEVFSHESSAI